MPIADELHRLLACDPAIRVAESPQFTDEPKIGVFSASRGDGAATTGHGIDADPGRARLKAVAEALERTCLFLPGELRPMRFGEDKLQVDPADLWCGAADNPASEMQRLRETPRLWAKAVQVGDGRECLIPAEAAYLDAARHTGAPIRPESISTGAALGAAGAGDAFTRGLFEVIERDVFMSLWLGGGMPRRIIAIEPADGSLHSQLERYRLEPRVFDLGRELGPPTVLAITIDRSGVGPAVTAGLAARGGYADAIQSALLESVGCRRGIRLKMARGKWPPPGSAEDIDSTETRAAFWAPVSSIDLLPRWVVDAPTLPFDALDQSRCNAYDALRSLARRDLAVYRCDLTTEPLAEAGFEVVRVVVPRLHPLHIAETARACRSWRGALEPNRAPPPHPFL